MHSTPFRPVDPPSPRGGSGLEVHVMYINLSKQPRKTDRARSKRYRAKLKRKQVKRVARMIK